MALTYGDERYNIINHALQRIDDDIALQVSKRAPCTVLLKPNMVRTNKPLAATHADALRAILDYLQKYDRSIKKIVIGEGPARDPAEDGFRNYDYYSLKETYAIEFMDLNQDTYFKVKILQIGDWEGEVRIARTSVDCDFKISVTVPKTHETVIFSGATKNFIMGSIIRDITDDKIKVHGFKNRREWDDYYTNAIKILPQNIVKLLHVLRPDLSVIDGFVAMEGNGPVAGSPLHLGIGVAGTDPIATDAVAASAMGFNPLDIGYLYYANREGLGIAELSDLEIVGETIKSVKKRCIPHENIELERTWRLP